MSKHAKLINPYASDPHPFGAAVQSNMVYLPPSGLRAFALRQINAIR